MSYIPKYILKRMLPKDCVKSVEGGGIEIQMVNVISPITIDEVPDNLLDYVEVKLDGKDLPDETLNKIEISFEGEVYQLDNAKDALGKTIPVGGKLNLKVPDLGLAAGEEHEVEVTIKTNNPINIKVKRTIQ
ncbi:MAG: hypothetical protein GF364_12400 [Candidatus Lokiarchaeota archaeon]|nr:hypothetical protein [Candidatus Lokiarchaeota archaeon]